MKPITVHPIVILLSFCLTATTGCVTQSKPVMATIQIPAAAAADSSLTGEKGGIGLSVVASIENGDVEEIFDSIDQLSLAFEPTDLLSKSPNCRLVSFPKTSPRVELRSGTLLTRLIPIS